MTVEIGKLKAAIKAEGLELDKEAIGILERVWRRLEKPDGCEWCGSHIKVGIIKGKQLVLSCCGQKIGSA